MISWLVDRFARLVASGQAPAPSEDAWSRAGGVYNNGALMDLSSERALQVSALICGARALAEGIAQVPAHVKRNKQFANGRKGWELAEDDARYRLIHRRPNDRMTSFELREWLILQAVLRGVGWALVTRGVNGRVHELLPIPAEWGSRYRAADGEYRLRVTVPGQIVVQGLTRADVIEVRGPSWDPEFPLETLRLAALALGLARNLEETAANTAARGGMAHCEAAWNKDPGIGVIGVQKGPL